MEKAVAHILICVVLLSTLSGCKTSAPTVKSLSEYKGRKLEYGSQGGITGGGTTISILENGQVFSTTTVPVGETEHSQTNGKDALALINEAEALIKKHAGLSGTGNMTYYLIYFDGAASHRITWAAEVFPPDDVKAFAQKVSQFVQKQNK